MKAHEILDKAAQHMKDRATQYDRPEGERSMAATVAAFNAITGQALTAEQGWLFQIILKAVRSQQNGYRPDNYEDLVAYGALLGEQAAEDRDPRNLPTPIETLAAEVEAGCENVSGQGSPSAETPPPPAPASRFPNAEWQTWHGTLDNPWCPAHSDLKRQGALQVFVKNSHRQTIAGRAGAIFGWSWRNGGGAPYPRVVEWKCKKCGDEKMEAAVEEVSRLNDASQVEKVSSAPAVGWKPWHGRFNFPDQLRSLDEEVIVKFPSGNTSRGPASGFYWGNNVDDSQRIVAWMFAGEDDES